MLQYDSYLVKDVTLAVELVEDDDHPGYLVALWLQAQIAPPRVPQRQLQ